MSSSLIKPVASVLTGLAALFSASPLDAAEVLPDAGRYGYSIASRHYGTLEGELVFEPTEYGMIARTPQYVLSLSGTGGRLVLNDGTGSDVSLETGVGGFLLSIESGPLRGEWQFTEDQASPDRDYASIAAALEQISVSWLYDPRLMETPTYTAFREVFSRCANSVNDDAAFIVCFENAWDGSLFSHYEILRPLATMDGLLAEADQRAEDHPVARYEAIGPDIALVTIDTFFGLEIEAQIDAAMMSAIESGAHNLIIDLRENGGGTTSAIPVAARIVEERSVLGVFISNAWWRDHQGLPTPEALAARPVLNDRPRTELMGDLVSTGYAAASLDPADNIFTGDVYVLTSARTASASEALVGMIKMTGRAVLIGETTAGQMLSSSFFPLPFEFSLRLPVADFYLSDGSRIDGVGVTPHIQTPAEDALQRALQEIGRE